MKQSNSCNSEIRLITEFIPLYLGIPVFLSILPIATKRMTGHALTLPVIPVLLIIFAIVLFILLKDKTFNKEAFYRMPSIKTNPKPYLQIAIRFIIGASLLTILLYLIKPEAILSFPKNKPQFWCIVMCCYPLISVYPQGVIYRALYEHRYSKCFPFPASLQILIGALAFACAHIPFGNIYAILFTFIGGIMFLSTYRATNSLILAAIEHALFGDFLFTIGWGQFFFHAGTLATLS